MKSDFGSSTDDRVLADTNILIYAHDPSDERKHGLAEALLTQLVDENRLVVSAQTLNEFYFGYHETPTSHPSGARRSP